MSFYDWLERTYGWIRKVPEPFKSILVVIFVYTLLPLIVAYCFYGFFKRRKNGKDQAIRHLMLIDG